MDEDVRGHAEGAADKEAGAETEVRRRFEAWDATCFALDVDRRYHLMQRRFFDGWHRIDLMVTAVAGSAAAALYFGSGTSWAPVLATAAAIAAALEIAFAPGRRAEEERACYRQAGVLLAALTREGPPADDAGLRDIEARKLEIDVDATVPNWTVFDLAYEEACRALERDNPHPRVGWLRRRFCRVFDPRPTD